MAENQTIDTLQLDIVVNSNKATSNLKNTTKEIDKLNDSIKGTSNNKGLSKIGKTLNFGAIVGKLYFVRNITKKLSDSLAKMVQYGIDFTETLNLWQTAMRGNVGEARTFISEMNKAYGIAEATLMKYQATFKNMLSAMGKISEDTAYGLSEALTNMALDFASLYNVSIEDAMTKFQAVLSGQVRPIRSISGYDITENTIFDLYKGLGGTKTMRQLSQTEKRLLSIYAVFQQMNETGALGDLQKTLYTNANQLRIMKEQAIEVATWFGNALSYLIQESGILVTINSYLFTAKELAKSLAYELGYREENFMTGFADSTEEASEEVDKLKGKLFSFDKFESLKSGEDTDISIESALTNALKNYNSLLSGITNPAQEKSVELLEKMGYELKYYAQVGDSVFDGGTLEEYNDWISTINESERDNVQTTEVWSKKGESLLESVKKVGDAISIIGITILAFTHPVLAVIAAIEYFYIKNEKFREAMNTLLSSLFPLIDSIVNIISSLIDILMPIIDPVIVFVSWLLDLIAQLFDWLAKTPEALYVVIGVLVGLSAIIAPIPTLIAAIGVMAGYIIKNWEKVLPAFQYVWGEIANGFASMINWIANGFIDFVNGCIKALNLLLTPISIVSEFFGGKKIEIGKWQAEVNWKPFPQYAQGGGFDTADLFYANENGSTELIASSNNGGAVMNMQQLENAIYSGMIKAFNQTSGDTTAKVEVTTKGGNALWDLITDNVVIKMKQRSII